MLRWLLPLLILQGEAPDLSASKKAVLDEKAPLADRRAAAERLALDREGAHFLIGLASERKLAAELEATVAGSIFRNADFGVRALASQYFKRPAAGAKPPPALADLLKLKGDASNGKKVFFGPASACSKCHLFEGEGGDVGPNLTEIRGKYDRAKILDAILNPSAEIAFGFEGVLVLMQDGAVYSGIVLGDGDELILKEASGEQRALPASKIRARKKLETSLMPDNAAVGLSAQDLADVAAFLVAER